MRHTRLTITLCLALIGVTFSPAFGNHLTGTLISPELLVAADFNQDGNLDLVVNDTGFDHVAILLGNGQGGFTLAGHFPTDNLPKGLQVADVNRDGHMDVVTCNNWGYDETVLLGDGLGAFHTASPPTEIDGDGEPVRMLLKDFNNDGLLDIASNAPDDSSILIFFGDGKGNFPAPAVEVEDVAHPFAMQSKDLNRDGNLDMVVVSPIEGHSQIYILLGDGTGEFTSTVLPIQDVPSSVQIDDLNNDGKLDLVVAGTLPESQTPNFVQTFLGNGRGGFRPQQNINLDRGNLKGDIALGDFNEDGKVDMCFPKTGLQDGSGNRSTIMWVFIGDGAGNFTQTQTLQVGAEPHTVIAVDFNHDGHLDLADTNRADGTVTCLLGDGHGNFTVSSTTSVLSPNE